MILNFIKKCWKLLNCITPETRSLIIILLFGYVLYQQINDSTKEHISNLIEQEINSNKQAEKYSMETSIEINE
jgi:hypothetical protein